jgi:hypothetical protein
VTTVRLGCAACAVENKPEESQLTVMVRRIVAGLQARGGRIGFVIHSGGLRAGASAGHGIGE